MRIKNKKTGEIVEITDPKQLAKYGLSVPKAQTGKIIKGKKANNTYNNNYEDIFNNRNPNSNERIQQEIGKKEYFDSKTPKKLKLGGVIKSDWEIIK